MSHEVHMIPPAPRRVLWRTALAPRWPLAAIGLILFVYGGLWSLMLFFSSYGKPHDDRRLDAAGVTTAATATGLRPSAAATLEWADYEFEVPAASGTPSTEVGKTLVERGTIRPGSTIQIEYLPENPSISRVRGRRITIVKPMSSLSVQLTVFPGLIALLVYFLGVFQVRRVLRHGDVAVASILRSRRVRWVVPEMLSVHYEFRDRRAGIQEGVHWVRVHSTLGARLLDDADELPVAHDRERPSLSRLISADQFHRAERRSSPLELPAE